MPASHAAERGGKPSVRGSARKSCRRLRGTLRRISVFLGRYLGVRGNAETPYRRKNARRSCGGYVAERGVKVGQARLQKVEGFDARVPARPSCLEFVARAFGVTVGLGISTRSVPQWLVAVALPSRLHCSRATQHHHGWLPRMRISGDRLGERSRKTPVRIRLRMPERASRATVASAGDVGHRACPASRRTPGEREDVGARARRGFGPARGLSLMCRSTVGQIEAEINVGRPYAR